jgi:hypothetical protein
VPTSAPEKIPLVVRKAMEFQPKSVLDVGFGFGKYGLLLREYLEFWGERPSKESVPYYERENWRVEIYGIDAYEPLTKLPHARSVYDRVDCMLLETAEWVGIGRNFDLVLFCDVLEHVTKRSGLGALQAFDGSVARHVIVTTPDRFTPQKAMFGNPHEEHRCAWTEAELGEFGLTVEAHPGFLFAWR